MGRNIEGPIILGGGREWVKISRAPSYWEQNVGRNISISSQQYLPHPDMLRLCAVGPWVHISGHLGTYK